MTDAFLPRFRYDLQNFHNNATQWFAKSRGAGHLRFYAEPLRGFQVAKRRNAIATTVRLG